MENYFQILTEIINVVSSDDLNAFKTLSTLLNHVNSSEIFETIWIYQLNAYEKLGDINLICLACKSSAEKVLEYLLTSEAYLYNLPYAVQKSSLLPEVEDEECHNAFYYAIRSNVCSLVEILVEKWPNDLFKASSDRLDNILSEAYKDLLVRNVCISKNMELYIKNKLMDLRFFDDTLAQSKAATRPIDNQHLKKLTMLRIDFVLENMSLVNVQFRESEADELILLSLKYIAKNIHMLKSAIMSPTKLPWEEIEFCLVIFIRSCSNRFEKDPLYHFVLNKKRIATHLENFSNILSVVKEKLKTARVNKIRKLVIKEISIEKHISSCRELYDDFTLIRDLYSLETMKRSIDLAISADASQNDVQLLITRALQVIGEHLKNTKDSPKLSDATNEILHSAVPPNLKKIITELRDCLSHAESLCRRSEIEESGQFFFTRMQSDINKMNLVVNEIFRRKKTAIIDMISSKLMNCKDFCSIKLYLEENCIFPFALKKELEEAEDFNMGNVEQLEKLVADLQKESEKELGHVKSFYRRIHYIITENDQSSSYTSKSMTLPTTMDKITQFSEESASYNKLLFTDSENVIIGNRFMFDKIYTFLPYELFTSESATYEFLHDRVLTKKLKVIKSALLKLKPFSGSTNIEHLLLMLKRLEETNTIHKKTVEECEKRISRQEQLIDNAKTRISEKFQIIHSVIHEEKATVKYFQNDYRDALQEFLSIISDSEEHLDISCEYETNHDLFQILTSATQIVIFFTKIEYLFQNLSKQFTEEKFPKGNRFTEAALNLYNFLVLHKGKIKWIEEFQKILKGHQDSQLLKLPKEISKFNKNLKYQLSMKIRSLRNFLNDYHLEDATSERVQLYEKNSKLRSIIEMLSLDVTECLSDCLNHNAFFLDDDYPLINGRNFRNHLAHGNALIDILFGDDFTNVILNASRLVKGDLLQSERCIGKKIKNDPLKSKGSHLKDLKAVKEQLALFAALSEGNIEEVEDCRRSGADLKGRSLDLWTSLHFAAKGPNLELVKLVMKFNPDAKVTDANLQTALHIASAHGRLHTVQYLVEEMKMETDVRDRDGKIPLHLASKNGHSNIVAFLLKHKAVKTSRDISGYTPVHYAAEENHIDTVAILLEKEKNVKESQTCSGLSPLHVAAKNGHLNLVVTLIENRQNAYFKPDVHFATSHHAAAGGHVEIVKYLIARGADVNARDKNGLTSLHLAVVKGRDEIAEILLEHGADVNAIYLEVWTPLSIVAKRGDLQTLKLLLEKGADINVLIHSGHTPLEVAAYFGHYEIVKTLLRGCNNNFKIKAFHAAAYKGYKCIVELFVKEGVDVNATYPFENKVTALHFAAFAGRTDIINFLVANGCDINAIYEYEDEDEDFTSMKQIFVYTRQFEVPDIREYSKHFTLIKSIHGQTALHMSCRGGNRDAVRCLIKNKADILIKDASALTPLECMVLTGMTDILIEEKVSVHVCDCDDFSPLHIAADRGDLKFLKYCLRDGCDINARSRISGYTPLHLAIEGGHLEMVEYLLDNGADVNARTTRNDTVLDIAVLYNRKNMLSILINRNFRISATAERRLLLTAVKIGYGDIVEYFLSRNPNNGLANAEFNEYPLHEAVRHGHRNILNMLLEKRERRGINDCNKRGVTPLVLAIEVGYCEITQFLISKGADPNIPSSYGILPLHLAIRKRSIEIVKILIEAKANIYLQGNSCNSAIELAIMTQNLDILETLLENSENHINFRGQEGCDLLRKAVTSGHLQAVKYLLERGVDIKAIDSQGDTPMHVAAMSGHQHIVEYFISLGFNIHNRINQSNLVHYAAVGNQSEFCEFLYRKGLDFNVSDGNDCTPLSLAIRNNSIDAFHALLHFGAYYEKNYIRNEIRSDNLSLGNFQMMVSLTLISDLFSAVRKNDISKTEALLSTALTFSKFGYANVRNSKNISLLHYAAWKGYGDIVDILLKYKANPNVVNEVNHGGRTKKGGSPLHYAAKFSHSRIVEALLYHGAVFDAVCDSGKTPLNYAKHGKIITILNFLNLIFMKIQNGEAAFTFFAYIKDMETRKALVRAKNIEGRTLIALAFSRHHPETELIKSLFQTDVSISLKNAEDFFISRQLEESIRSYQIALQKRIDLFGPDDPGVLDIQIKLSAVFASQKNFPKALSLAESVYKTQREILGESSEYTLFSKIHIASILGRQGHHDQALNKCVEILREQIETSELSDSETHKTQINLVQFLRENSLCDSDLKAQIRKNICQGSEKTAFSLLLKQQIARELGGLGKHREALEVLLYIYEQQKEMFGLLHQETISTLYDIGVTYSLMKKLEDALKNLKKVLKLRSLLHGPNHFETLHVQCCVADNLFSQRMYDEALEIYKTNLETRTTLFGSDDPKIQEIQERIDNILSHQERQVMPHSIFFNRYPVLPVKVWRIT